MKKIISFLLLIVLVVTLIPFNDVWAVVHVRGYYRKNGTYVAPHYRSDPDGNFNNNWSTKGNINPYTGEEGTKTNHNGTGGTFPSVPVVSTPSYCPSNSTMISGSCVCDSGYIFKNNQCITHTQNCQLSFGQNVLGAAGNNNSSCRCLDGYSWNNEGTSCIEIINKIVCPLNSYEINGQCNCVAGYINEGTGCVSINTKCKQLYGRNAVSASDTVLECDCAVGYKWDQEKTSCIVTECDGGFSPSLSKSHCVRTPLNAHPVESSTDVWMCDDGYKEVGDMCVLIKQPRVGVENGVDSDKFINNTSNKNVSWFWRVVKFLFD